MNGSKTVKERIFLLNNVDKIIFNSRWSQNRFFLDIKNKDDLLLKTSVCYQSSSKIKVNFHNNRFYFFIKYIQF